MPGVVVPCLQSLRDTLRERLPVQHICTPRHLNRTEGRRARSSVFLGVASVAVSVLYTSCDTRKTIHICLTVHLIQSENHQRAPLLYHRAVRPSWKTHILSPLDGTSQLQRRRNIRFDTLRVRQGGRAHDAVFATT